MIEIIHGRVTKNSIEIKELRVFLDDDPATKEVFGALKAAIDQMLKGPSIVFSTTSRAFPPSTGSAVKPPAYGTNAT